MKSDEHWCGVFGQYTPTPGENVGSIMTDDERLAQIKSINEGYRTKPCCQGGYESVEAIDYLLKRTDGIVGVMEDQVTEAQMEVSYLRDRVKALENVSTNARKMNAVMLQEANPLEDSPGKCPAHPHETCLSCIYEAWNDVDLALAVLNQIEGVT